MKLRSERDDILYAWGPTNVYAAEMLNRTTKHHMDATSREGGARQQSCLSLLDFGFETLTLAA